MDSLYKERACKETCYLATLINILNLHILRVSVLLGVHPGCTYETENCTRMKNVTAGLSVMAEHQTHVNVPHQGTDKINRDSGTGCQHLKE